MTFVARAFVAVALGCALGCAAGPATAAPAEWSDALSPGLQRMKATRVIRLGYRENAVPFSYLGPDGMPIGYSIDLCRSIAATIAEDLGIAALGIDYVRVTAQDRIEQVKAGSVDLECGATTNTAERRRQVAFSSVIFVTGTRLAVPRGSRLREADDLRGRRVAVVRGTTNEAAMREVDRLRGLGIRFVDAGNYRDALAAFDKGDADAIAADEVLLRGFLAETGRARDVRIVGEMLSFEPYGIMFARDESTLADAVDRTLRSLAQSREIVWIYNRWFVLPLPSGERLAMPMSEPLRRSFELIGLPPD